MVDQRHSLQQLVGPSVPVGHLGLATRAGLPLGVVGNGPRELLHCFPLLGWDILEGLG